MIVRSSRRHRFTLRLVLTIVSALPIAATASDFDSRSDVGPTPGRTVASAPCEFELAGTEELCGWVEMGSHDSGALPTPVQPRCETDKELAAESTPSSDSSVESPMAAIAAAVCASAGVSVEQIVEPFAMVGPYLDESIASVNEFQNWWATAIAAARSMQAGEEASGLAQETDVQAELDAIAAQEPIDIEPADIEGFGPSVLVEAIAPAATDRIQAAKTSPLVGGSAIIVTLEESYLPYDLAARDVKLWSVFPVRAHPFCIRSHASNSPLWDELDELASSNVIQPVATSESDVQCGSADCHLEELIWRVETWTADDSPVWEAVKPRNIGHRFATLAVGSNRLVSEAAQLLASRWPEVEERIAPSPAGEALLARAGAIEASEPQVAEAQIAELPGTTNLR